MKHPSRKAVESLGVVDFRNIFQLKTQGSRLFDFCCVSIVKFVKSVAVFTCLRAVLVVRALRIRKLSWAFEQLTVTMFPIVAHLLTKGL